MKNGAIGLATLAVMAGCAAGPAPNVAAAGPSAPAALMVKAPSAAQLAVFGVLSSLPGRRFTGEVTAPDGTSFTDFQHWEWALGGNAISCTHVLGDGSYGGETLIYPDAKGTLQYVYVTTGGFRTEGSFSLTGVGVWQAEEAVLGHPTITMVRSTGSIEGDRLLSTSSYLDGGVWVEGQSFEYRETDAPLPPFRPLAGPDGAE